MKAYYNLMKRIGHFVLPAGLSCVFRCETRCEQCGFENTICVSSWTIKREIKVFHVFSATRKSLAVYYPMYLQKQAVPNSKSNVYRSRTGAHQAGIAPLYNAQHPGATPVSTLYSLGTIASFKKYQLRMLGNSQHILNV